MGFWKRISMRPNIMISNILSERTVVLTVITMYTSRPSGHDRFVRLLDLTLSKCCCCSVKACLTALKMASSRSSADSPRISFGLFLIGESVHSLFVADLLDVISNQMSTISMDFSNMTSLWGFEDEPKNIQPTGSRDFLSWVFNNGVHDLLSDATV